MNRDDEATQIESYLVDGLMKVVAAHAARNQIEISTVGYYAVGDARLFQRIEDGGSMTVYQYGRVLHWIYDRWPDDVAWPVGVIQPGRRRPVVSAPVRGRPSISRSIKK